MAALDFIEKQKPHNQEILYALRDIILSTVIGFREMPDKYLPVYHYLEACCFLGLDRKKGPYIAFVKGIYMQTQEAFSVPDTKMIRKIHYKTLDDIDVLLLQSLLYEAVEINKARNRK
jgi:hypothetical protein